MSLVDQQKTAPPEYYAVVNFLRSGKAGLKLRTGVLNGKRIDYFKGSSAVKALQSPAYAKLKSAPKVTSESEAVDVLGKTLRYAFFLRIDRGDSISLTASGAAGQQPKTKKAKVVSINQMQQFQAELYFAWFYEGSMWTTYAGGLLMVVVLLAGVMFPLWPPIMRQGVSYLSMGVLGLIGLFFVVAILRLIFWLITIVVVPPGIWIFPQLFADVGFVDSFIPFWEWDIKKKKKKAVAGEKKSGKSGSKSGSRTGTPSNGATLAVPDALQQTDSDISRPPSRASGRTPVQIEEVEDED